MEGDVSSRLPLRGVRVLDLGMVWAGPQAATLLADLGADVVKVEGPNRPDPFRAMYGAADPRLFPAEEAMEWSPLFCGLNRNKRGIALDLRDPDGVEACRRLAAAADAVLDNFSTRVLPNLGLDYARLRAANHRLVSCSMSGFGRTGPLRDAVTYGPMVEQLSGGLALSGYPDVGPVGLASAFDAIAGCYGAVAISAALLGRQRSGHAADLDFASMESGPCVTGSLIADRQLGRSGYVRDGNADPDHAPHRMYPCRGDDAWVAICVRSDAAFAALAGVAGHPGWATDPRFATAADRKRNEAELDAAVAAWTATLSPDEVAIRLQQAGVVSAPLRSVREAVAEPRLRDAGAFVSVDRRPQGRREYQAPLMVVDGVRAPVRRPAPRHGEHTDEVLADWARPLPDELPRAATISWLPPLAAGDPPLRGVGAVLRATSEAAAVAARILADLGATVWRDAGAAGAAARRHAGARAFHGAGLAEGEPDGPVHIVIGDARTPASGAPAHLCIDDTAGGWQLDDLSACALSSLSWRIGDPGREPLQPGRGYASAVAGSVAVVTAIALLIDAGRGSAPPPPRQARVSLLESALQVGAFDTVVLSFGGEPPPRSRRPWPTLVFACSDGWVGIFPRTDEMWESLCAMTDAVDLIGDPRLHTFSGRQQHTEVIRNRLAPWFAAHTRAEADEAARAMRVPLALVCDPLDVLSLEQYRFRRLFVPALAPTGEPVELPGLPFLIDGARLGAGRVVPAQPSAVG